MPSTYESIATTTLTSSANTVSFTSIPATYTDIVVSCKFQKTTTDNFWINFNGDSASNYSETWMVGNGSSAASGRESSTTRILLSNGVGDGPNGMAIIHIFSYLGSTNKTILTRNGDAAIATAAAAGLWRNTAAITSLAITTQVVNPWNAGTTFTLYGIKAA
jgi:hypothetical protein